MSFSTYGNGTISGTIASTAAAGSAAILTPTVNWNIFISIASGTPTGTIYLTNIQSASDTGSTEAPWISIPVNSGLFLNGKSVFNLPSGSSMNSGNQLVSWVPSGTPAGSITIAGLAR